MVLLGKIKFISEVFGGRGSKEELGRALQEMRVGYWTASCRIDSVCEDDEQLQI